MKKKKAKNSQELPLKIADAAWNRMLSFLKDNHGRCVGDPEKCRLFLSAIMWIAKNDVPWSAIPNEYGNWKTIYDRFRRWCNVGVFEAMLTHFYEDYKITSTLSPLYGKALKTRIQRTLRNQGFKIQGNQVILPKDLDKEMIRKLHTNAVHYKIEERKKGLIEHEMELLKQFAHGREVVPDKINPELIEVHSGSIDELIFRYASLHWSIPVSSGYGRRLRYLVKDQYTGKLMGLFGLGDPVISLKDRDNWIGWDQENRRKRLRHVVDAYVLGAVPPYSFLIGGKLMALLATSNKVRKTFQEKYEGKTSLILNRSQCGKIALVTTASALGRSSLYNRLKCAEPYLSAQPNVPMEQIKQRVVFECVGHTKGFGDFHFANGIYDFIMAYAKLNDLPTTSHESWSAGYRSRKNVVQVTLTKLGLPQRLLNHGIKREIYVAPLAENTQAFLCGIDSELNYYNQPVSELFKWYRERWLLPRSDRDSRYKEWHPQEWVLWTNGENSERIN